MHVFFILETLPNSGLLHHNLSYRQLQFLFYYPQLVVPALSTLGPEQCCKAADQVQQDASHHTQVIFTLTWVFVSFSCFYVLILINFTTLTVNHFVTSIYERYYITFYLLTLYNVKYQRHLFSSSYLSVSDLKHSFFSPLRRRTLLFPSFFSGCHWTIISWLMSPCCEC